MSYLNRSFLENIGTGGYSNIASWTKIGYAPSVTTTETDIWSYSATQAAYVFCASAETWEVLSSDNTKDKVTTIHDGGAATSGSTTSITVTGENFNTTTIAGDYIIIDKGGTTPEWGVITTVNSDTQLTFSAGLSSGGSAASRTTYHILDKSSYTGAQAVRITGLDSTYAEISEIVILNGTTVVATTKSFFRVNSFRVVLAGTDTKPTGNLTLRASADTPVYSYITAGFTRARNNMYTVPLGKTLYVTSWNAGFSVGNDSKFQVGRLYTRANVDNVTGFNTGNIFYNYTEVLCTNNFQSIIFQVPTKLPAKTDIKISGIALNVTGVVASALRGFLVS